MRCVAPLLGVVMLAGCSGGMPKPERGFSQTRSRAAAFLPEQVVDQRVVAVYFDAKHKVGRIADSGLQDGKIFDFVSRTTPTAGVDQSFVQQLFSVISNARPKL